jgi:hypothetical protein
MRKIAQSTKWTGLCAMLLGCAACSITGPISIIADNGQVLRGTYRASVTSGGSLAVTDGVLNCTGSYDSSDRTARITIPVKCSDGRFGLAEITRLDGRSGGGTVKLNDGARGIFVFGSARMACSTIGERIGGTAQAACMQESVRVQSEARASAQRDAEREAVALEIAAAGLSILGAAFIAIATPTHIPPSTTYRFPPPFVPTLTPVPGLGSQYLQQPARNKLCIGVVPIPATNYPGSPACP